jgi:hypothetical protein
MNASSSVVGYSRRISDQVEKAQLGYRLGGRNFRAVEALENCPARQAGGRQPGLKSLKRRVMGVSD